ncbi:S1 family peptidase [Aquitalea aquatilis]|uniref:S1 family peptidase n=1 Tax=Aquitalea aquatilis TaxID=1537400 RepID=UPI0010BDC45E|nr:serine protease [Aquitalea aquatilis]
MPNRFALNTFETFEIHSPRKPYGETANDGVPFPIDDPFGLRRAVVPVFLRNPDGSAEGVGTAFHVDGWGRLLTADHVVDRIRTHHLDQVSPDTLIEVDITRSSHAAVLLGYGVVFGTAAIPSSCWAPMDRVDAILTEKNVDPMAALRGRSSPYQIGPDIAGMSAVLQPDAPPFHTVPVNFQTYPEVGEAVFAVGYPELGFEALNGDEIARYLKEGMFGVYGRVTNLCPDGRGNRPSPGFEVEADWRPGMSGGPVFNERGEVIGIVSSSLPPSDEGPGIGYATSLAMIPNASRLVPTLDIDNPGCRLGFGVYRTDPWHLSGVFKSQDDAEHLRTQLSPGYCVGWGSHRLGGDNFMHSMPK